VVRWRGDGGVKKEKVGERVRDDRRITEESRMERFMIYRECNMLYILISCES
jgi:hypothetical protein